MTSRPTNPLKSILHPYVFVLKEGGKIKNDFLDYSLMMLFVHSRETIASPFDEKFANTLTKKKPLSKSKRP